ncbi:imidazole glycerol phosphate synthase subunit HisF [Candidatus Uhrbacteria bacterium]|nr:imidazole glycerol phosphate synthase subunit HisF [Candidatus Uhrbacteria bacterium]
MLKKRLITVLTFNNGVLFRTRNFIPDYRYTLNFVDAWSVDEVVLLDITRPGEGERKSFYNVVEQFAEKCFVPLAAGGLVRSIDEVQTLLRHGADKVIVNTEGFRRPYFITEIAKLYGSQCAVVSIDAKLKTDSTYEVYIEQGRVPTGRDPVSWAREAQAAGAGEILITSIDRDGMLEGYDNALNRIVSEAVDIPVLVCGGAGNWQNFVDGFQEGGASAVCTANIYHFTEASIKSAKQYLMNAGIDIRA